MKNLETTQNSTNDLRFTTSKTVSGEEIIVKIRLNDECKNGHQDFSITGDIYKAGKPRIDKYYLGGGCIHEVIVKYFPEFLPFIKLHLCDVDGVPMHAVANGFYHLREGFNNTKPDSIEFAVEFCGYYRIKPEQFEVLKTAKNQTQYAMKLVELGILTQWKAEAEAAIKELERLTGKTFINDSEKSQYYAPTPEAIAEEQKRQEEGYYTPEAEEKRKEAAKQAEFTKLENEYNKQVEKARLEYEVKKEVLTKGGAKALKNCIFYSHTKQLAFNWAGYDPLPVEYLNELIATLELPEGVTAKIATK